MMWRRLSFRALLDPGQVATWLSAVATQAGTLQLVASGRAGRLEHHLALDDARLRSVERLSSSLLPDLRLDELDDELELQATLVVGLRLSDRARPLRRDVAAGLASGIQAALVRTRPDERLTVQWLLRPGGEPAPAVQRPVAKRPPAGRRQLHADADAARAARAKQAEPQLHVVCRIGVVAPDRRRAKQLVGRVLQAVRAVEAPGVQVRVRSDLLRLERSRFIDAKPPWLVWPLRLNPGELAPLLSWPITGAAPIGFETGGSRHLTPHSSLERRAARGFIIGSPTAPGTDAPVALRRTDANKHLHVIGPTGVGKSTLLAQLAIQSAAARESVILIDPKGDLVDDVLARLPEQRLDDVVVLDPADADAPVGLNPLKARQSDVAVDNLVGTISRLFASSWGPRTDDLLRSALLTLVNSGEAATLADIPALLTNPIFRRRIVTVLDEPLVLEGFWSQFEGLSAAERSKVISPLMNKLRALISRPALRGMLGQAEPHFDLSEVFSERRIVLAPLSVGQLGEDTAQLIGALLVTQVWQHTQAQATVPAARRRPVRLIIDEFQRFTHLPTPLGDVLAAARGYGLGLVLAHQHLGQLSSELQTDVLSDARSRVVFQTNARDAGVLVRDMPGIDADDLLGLGAYEVMARLAVGPTSAPTVSLRTQPLPPAEHSARQLRARSRARFGRPRAETDQRLLGRQRPDHGSPQATSKPAGFGFIIGDEPIDGTGEDDAGASPGDDS